jgi:pyruvate formate lyase activating enzyme
MQASRFFTPVKNGKIKCGLCNHFCLIDPGKTGICRSRINKEGKLYSAVYGYPANTGVDPVEKKPLYHFKPGSLAFSFGTMGCNFSCANCHNWKLSQMEDIENEMDDMDFMPPEKIICAALEEGCQSIAFTYNEPTIFTEYALDIMKLAYKNDLKNIWVSNGYMSTECLDAIMPYLDAVNIDLKSMDENFYKHNCNSKLKPVLENLTALKQEQAHLEITTLIIPSINDDLDELSGLAEFIANELGTDTPWHISRFSPKNSWKLKDAEETEDDIMYEAFEIGKNSGLKYVYVGNMPGDQKESTYCPKCGELAIARSGNGVERFDSRGRCAYCDRNLDIID